MSKRIWDGSFNESQYIETGNIVNDVIENNGRLLHEPTSDGYTHEVVDRGAYISDDYYFPQRTSGKKPHIHYEIRSNGNVLIDGKSILENTTGGNNTMLHGRELGRNHNLDGTILKKESEDRVQEGVRLHELGTKFESDKAKLEKEIEKVENSKISDTDKSRIVAQLEVAIASLQEQYKREVTEEERKVQEELEEQIESMQEAADEVEKQVDSFRNVQMDVASTDTSDAVTAAEAQKKAFETMKSEYVEKLKLQMEQAEIQQQNIRNRSLRGR